VISPSKRILAAVSTLALAGAATGCGEKEEPATTGAQVTTQGTSTAATTTTTTPQTTPGLDAPQVVTLFLTSPDAQRVCDDLLTPAFLRKAYGDRAGCLAGRKPSSLSNPNPKLEVTPGPAETVVIAQPKGGVYDGQRLKITLIKDGTGERIDAVTSNVPVGP